MTDSGRFSTYEAKARFSEVLRRVREGCTVTVTYHGEPVAESRPLHRSEGMAARLEWMSGRGVLSLSDATERRFEPVASKLGALRRFLEDRNG